VAFQEGARLDGQILMEDVADDVGGFGELDGTRLDLAVDGAVNAHRFSDDLALDLGCLADKQRLGANIALDDAIDLDLAITAEIADDLVISDGGAGFGGAAGAVVSGLDFLLLLENISSRADEFHRVPGPAVKNCFVVQMRSRAATRIAEKSDLLAEFHFLATLNIDFV